MNNLSVTFTEKEICESLLAELEALTDEEWDMLSASALK